jgi:POTRA domain, FtsQ-type
MTGRHRGGSGASSSPIRRRSGAVRARSRFGRRRLPAVLGSIRGLLSPARAAALLGLVIAIVAVDGLTTSPLFAVHRVDLPALRWTNRDEILQRLAIPDGQNAFEVATANLGARLEQLPGIAAASVNVSLPDGITVEVTEREPVLAWKVGDASYLVDRNGILFALARGDAIRSASVPTIADSRASSSSVLAVGTTLDPIDLDVATRLASLVPSDLGSGATGLTVGLSDASGFTLTASPHSWIAVFGFYSQVLRTPDLVPGQVRLLRSLLVGRESGIARIVLSDDRNGTYLPVPTPR